MLDVAQLLLAAIDTSTVTLPPKQQTRAETRKACGHGPGSRLGTGRGPSAPAAADTAQKEAKPVTGLGIAGGAKRPGAKKAAPLPRLRQKPLPAAPTAAAPVKGLGIAAGAKRPGAQKPSPAAAAPAAPTEAAPAAPTEAAPPKPAAAAPVKGLGIAAGAKRPGAKKSTPPAEPAAAEPTPAAAQPESTARNAGARGRRRRSGSAPTPPVKGLGIARGARPPGKR